MAKEETIAMVHHVCFPTDIFEIPGILNDDDMKKMLKYINKEYLERNYDENWQLGWDLHTKEEFKKLAKFIITLSKDLIKSKGFDAEDIKITDMWVNVLKPGESHPPHTHSNNYLTGVYYLHAEQASALCVFDPVRERDAIRPRKKWDDKGNSSTIMFQAIPNTAYIFPAWLNHWVPNNVSETNRISVSWNISLVGQVGEHHEFQSAEFK